MNRKEGYIKSKRQKLKVEIFLPWRNKKDGFLQISFGWLFAIIIGAIILFFAIYFSARLINTEETLSTTQTGKEIAVLLNPLETGFNEEKTTPLTISIESIIYNKCSNFGDFGEQEISISQKVNGKWTETGLEQIFYNKYIFSNNISQGKNFYLFSKSFNFPFKVADLIILTSSQKNYCFVNASESVKKELLNLNQPNFFIENCPTESIKICFDNFRENDCYVNVNTRDKSVKKIDEEPVYYETDALMFAAVFSDRDLYECQVKRLMKRLETLALLYNDKQAMLSRIGCVAEIDLFGLTNSASSLRDSSGLIDVKMFALDADNENKRANCRLW